jgi:diphosphomevalonate decarboxylase
LLAGAEWPLEVAIAITAKGEKEVGSRSGMERSADSSPYYSAWIATQDGDLRTARDAIRERDFAALAEVAERNCLKMHAAALAATPPLLYWNGATVECVHAIRRLRASGVPVFFTIDAGPQVKAICLAEARPRVEAALREVPGVLDVLSSRLGPGAELR